MNRFVYLRHRIFPYTVVILTYVIYVTGFLYYHVHAGIGVASLAIIPISAASWYFGIWGGLLMAVISVLSNTAILMLEGNSLAILYETPGNILGTLSLLITAGVVGQLSTTTRERSEAISKLKQYEGDRESHTMFLELLN